MKALDERMAIWFLTTFNPNVYSRLLVGCLPDMFKTKQFDLGYAAGTVC